MTCWAADLTLSYSYAEEAQAEQTRSSSCHDCNGQQCRAKSRSVNKQTGRTAVVKRRDFTASDARRLCGRLIASCAGSQRLTPTLTCSANCCCTTRPSFERLHCAQHTNPALAMSAMSRADSLSASSPAPLNTSPKLELPQSAAMKQTTSASSAGTTSQAVDSAAVDGTAVADITSPHELTNWVIDRWLTFGEYRRH